MAELEKEFVEADAEFKRLSETVVDFLTRTSNPGPGVLERMLEASDRLDEIRQKLRKYGRMPCGA